MYQAIDQINHEKKYGELAAARYFSKQDKLRETDRADEVDGNRRVMRDCMLGTAETLDRISRNNSGVGGKYNRLLRVVATFEGEVDFLPLAYLAVQQIFKHQAGNSNWTAIATSLGAVLEFEHKTRKFESENPGYYYVLMQSMEEQQVSSYKHKRNVLAKKMTDFDMEWTAWDYNTVIQLANKILISVLHNTKDVFFRGTRQEGMKTIAYLGTTVIADEWLADFEAERGFLQPDKLPMLIKPDDWMVHDDGSTTGGYLTGRLSTEITKAHLPVHKQFVHDNPPLQHIAAINKMQGTAWTINEKVYKVQQDIMSMKNVTFVGLPNMTPIEPPVPLTALKGVVKETMTEAQLTTLKEFKQAAKGVHRANKARKGRAIQFKMSYDLATLYKRYDEFYFVYTADFRGRIYSQTTGLSPQGADPAKSLLMFANARPVTESGLRWLAIHGANTFGNDKISYDDRVQYIKDNEDVYKRIAADPFGCRTEWECADKPWQFLAFIFEWEKTEYGNNPLATISIPIGLDGSCNGLQHYSALLRDKSGGSAVNLINSDIPNDIYTDVSQRLGQTLHGMGNDKQATAWLQAGFDRKLTKRPVMTLPYGSTQNSTRAYIFEWALENKHKFPDKTEAEIFSLCIWLTPHLWQAISEVVIAARAGMDWIQSRASAMYKDTGQALKWLSPVRFPVYQPYVKYTPHRVRTTISGGVNIMVRTSYVTPTDEVDPVKQRSGIAPNFVHSLDSSHMVSVINATNFQDYAMIHDDFGTHACDIEVLQNAIRHEFVDMYTEHDYLKVWNEYQAPDYDGCYPDTGDLSLNEVINSAYFFG